MKYMLCSKIYLPKWDGDMNISYPSNNLKYLLNLIDEDGLSLDLDNNGTHTKYDFSDDSQWWCIYDLEKNIQIYSSNESES